MMNIGSVAAGSFCNPPSTLGYFQAIVHDVPHAIHCTFQTMLTQRKSGQLAKAKQRNPVYNQQQEVFEDRETLFRADVGVTMKHFQPIRQMKFNPFFHLL